MSSFKTAILNRSYIGEMKERLWDLPCSSLVVLCVSNHPDSTVTHRRINPTPVFADFCLVNYYQPIVEQKDIYWWLLFSCVVYQLFFSLVQFFTMSTSLVQNTIIQFSFRSDLHLFVDVQSYNGGKYWHSSMLMFSHVGIYFLPVFTSLQIDWVIFDCLIYLQVYWWERIKKTRNEGQRSEGLWTFHTAQTTYNSPSLTQDPASPIRSQTVPGQLSLFHLCLRCMAALFSICGRLTSLIKSGFWRAVMLISSWHPMPLINLLGNVLLKECKKTFHRLAVRQVWCCTGPLLNQCLALPARVPKRAIRGHELWL